MCALRAPSHRSLSQKDRLDVIAQIKKLITTFDAQLTPEERNLLSIAYKNTTGTLRSSWRTIDVLEKKEGHSKRQLALMQVEKDRIQKELDDTCKDVVKLMETHLIPAADSGEEKVFYSKMHVVFATASCVHAHILF